LSTNTTTRGISQQCTSKLEMVLLQRRAWGTPSKNATLTDDFARNGLALGYGDAGPGRHQFLSLATPSKAETIPKMSYGSRPSLLSPYRKPRLQRNDENDVRAHSTWKRFASWIIAVVFCLIGLLGISWIVAEPDEKGDNRSSIESSDLEPSLVAVSASVENVTETNQTSSSGESPISEIQALEELKEVRDALENESRMANEILSSKTGIESQEEVLPDWLVQRRTAMINRITILQDYLKETSRSRVIAK
jgi:hypothetical protein